MSNRDLYNRLNLTPTASEAEIKKAYRKLSLKFHPDKGGNQDAFQRICEAYEVLSNPERRKTYNETGRWESRNGVTDEDEALGLIRGIFNGLLTDLTNYNFDQDPIKEIRSRLGVLQKTTTMEAKKHKNNLGKLKRMGNRFRFDGPSKEEKPGLFQAVLNANISNIENAMAGLAKRDWILGIALDVLRRWEFRTDSLSAPTRGSSMDFMREILGVATEDKHMGGRKWFDYSS